MWGEASKHSTWRKESNDLIDVSFQEKIGFHEMQGDITLT